jgi:hypothetical protein
MNPALSPAELHHLGVSNENRTHDSGITTRGFATKLWTPYGNTLLLSYSYCYIRSDVEPVILAKIILFIERVCFHMVGAQGLEP